MQWICAVHFRLLQVRGIHLGEECAAEIERVVEPSKQLMSATCEATMCVTFDLVRVSRIVFKDVHRQITVLEGQFVYDE